MNAAVNNAGYATRKEQVAATRNCWGCMSRRCSPTHRSARWYYQKGIVVCDRWRESFEDFVLDVGLRLSPAHSLDRYPNNAGNYEPGNVRWATQIEQHRNKSSCARIEYLGRPRTYSELAELSPVGLTKWVINHRIRSGYWTVEDAVTTPLGERTHYARGERHWSARTTDAAVQEIRAEAASGASPSVIASRRGLSVQAVDDIIARRTWKHLP